MYSSSDVYTTRGGCAHPKSVESSFSTDQNICYIRHACIYIEVGCIWDIIILLHTVDVVYI